MLWTVTLWLYASTATLVVVHEIDSAYWQEWKLLHLPGGRGGFVLLHVPIVALLFYGTVALDRQRSIGVFLALAVAAGALAAGGIHAAFLHAGHEEFRATSSLVVLALGTLAGLALAVCAFAILYGAT